MAMTVDPRRRRFRARRNVHVEAIYAFRFDLNGDHREELTFKFRFGAVTHADGDEHRHVQSYEVRRATGNDALHVAPKAEMF